MYLEPTTVLQGSGVQRAGGCGGSGLAQFKVTTMYFRLA